MSSFTQYLNKFTKNTEKKENLTHLSLSKGKYNVPEECYDEFYEKYYENLTSDNPIPTYLVEKTNNNFSFFLDIEVPKKCDYKIKTDDILEIIKVTNECINKMFDIQNMDNYITRRNNNYHINFPDLIVNSMGGQLLSKNIINTLEMSLKKLIDTSVYRTGLRIFGSKKSEIDIKNEIDNYTGDPDNYSSVYEVYDIELNELYNNCDISFGQFMKLIIRRKSSDKLTEIKEEFKIVIPSKNPIKSNSNPNISTEISRLLDNIRNENLEHLQNYNFDISKINSTQNKSAGLCYYITLNDKMCPFYSREHTRTQSPIYIELSLEGIYIKCHDEDCLRRKYPDEGLKLPSNFEQEYCELYMSMTSKYWKSEITITPEIKRLLEDSLTGSHYKIAKVIFNIYKDRFRIDDIKNPEWYEFDGARWSKTHIMNILISEELQKYYKGIKISDTGALQSNDLKDFIETKDKLEANMRNSLIDNIINKLENVGFKKNIMIEMHYLFKSLEPNFVSKLDANPYLLGFKNGVYDLEKKEFRSGLSSDYLTLSTGYDYLEYDSELPEIKEVYTFLRQIIPNKKVFEYLMKILGRSLCGINDEKFYIFTGLSGANGKSTLINFLELALGDLITSADVSLLTNVRALSSSASPDVIRLKGKRIVSFAEPESNDTLKVGIIKAFSGGDQIIARELYKSPIAFKLQASMIMCCNSIPQLSNSDGGIERRLRIIEFTSKFCDNPKKSNEFKIDPTIKSKITGWRPYLMSILLHYYLIHEEELLKTGTIEEPEEVKIATNKYKEENDRFNDYFNECVDEKKGTFESIKNIYNNFIKWFQLNSSTTKIPDIKELRKSLKIKFGEEITKVTHNGIKQLGFYVKLNTPENFEESIIDEDY